jgi:hypothetical protein
MTLNLDKITTSVAEIYFSEDGILRVKYFPEAEVELKEAIEIEKHVLDLANGIPRLIIIDTINSYVNYSPEAREYMARSEKLSKIRKAFAILVNNLSTKLIANFYLRFNRPPNPGKVFNSEDKAIAWLKSFE